MNEDIGDVVRLTMKSGDVRIVVTPGLEGVRSTNAVSYTHLTLPTNREV